MIRITALFIAATAFTFTACERHPLPGQATITHTHGADGPGGHDAAKHEAGAKHEEKKTEHAPGAPASEAPKFFPEKK